MARLIRLDTELARRSLAKSRTHAAQLISAGRVKVDGEVATKAARQVNPAQAIVVTAAPEADYASRGAYKLLGALDALAGAAPRIEGVVCLDAGASTGGFTDVLLRRGASQVMAVDVGYGQLAWHLQQDSRVIVMDRTNVRTLQRSDLAARPGLIVSDLSFISLTTVLPALSHVGAPGADYLLMVKPQFEVGREFLPSGGVVRDPNLHIAAIAKVMASQLSLGHEVKAVAASPLPGPAGNVEYFIHTTLAQPHPDAPAPDGPGEGGPARAVTSYPQLIEATDLARIEAAVKAGPACAK